MSFQQGKPSTEMPGGHETVEIERTAPAPGVLGPRSHRTRPHRIPEDAIVFVGRTQRTGSPDGLSAGTPAEPTSLAAVRATLACERQPSGATPRQRRFLLLSLAALIALIGLFQSVAHWKQGRVTVVPDAIDRSVIIT